MEIQLYFTSVWELTNTLAHYIQATKCSVQNTQEGRQDLVSVYIKHTVRKAGHYDSVQKSQEGRQDIVSVYITHRKECRTRAGIFSSVSSHINDIPHIWVVS